MTGSIEYICRHHEQIAELFGKVSDPEADRRAALAELIRQIPADISVEQSVVAPVLKSRGVGGSRTMKELRKGDRQMGRLLSRIERRKVDSPDLPDMVTDLKDRFDRHVRLWEGIGDFDAKLAPADREALSERITNAEDTILSHPHPHLLSLGPVSRLTTRLAGRFDRARDRTVTNLP
jgi:hypothetical protein